MARIVIVHGIGNQYAGQFELHAAWFPALCSGLSLANAPLPEPGDCVCAFYGDLFRAPAALGMGAVHDDDLDVATPDEVELLRAIWESAAATDQTIPSAAAFARSLAWAPRIAERALTALAKSRFLADAIPIRWFGDLRQVVTYLNDAAMRRQILDRVLPHIGPETKLVIGHSLGSVIAYEAVCEKPERVDTLLTLGSPLGIRNVVFDKLTPAPWHSGAGRWPGELPHWTNIAATGDIVAAQKTLKPLFGGTLQDIMIDSGWDAHSSTRYLNTIDAGRAVARALSA